ncbi:MAG: septum formation protein Maf [Fibrobacterales bacterium]|nr:septum formation protein Maf [Fibrobacterales bacterium]MBP5187986.1 septum formation protein Maf [Fibrobacterales bacterium]
MTAPLVLASGSPRRRAILERIGVPFVCEKPDCPEVSLPGEPERTVLSNARAKALSVSARRPGDRVLGCDTVVALDGALFGKPGSEEEARAMLRALAGRTHDVWTGLALVRGGRILGERAARTRVRFRAYGEEEIDRQIASGEPMDKAGAYGIQSFGARLVESVEGCFYNVVGLPIFAVIELLESRGREP